MRRKWFQTACIAFVYILAITSTSVCQEPAADVQKQIDELKKVQESILKELKEVKSFLVQKTNPEANVRDVEFEVAGNPIMGSNSAKLILIEFSDYECAYCGRHAREALPDIIRQYIDTGILAYTLVDMPLPNHKEAAKAAEASRCANEQGKYWEMHDQMMQKQEALGDLSALAKFVNLNVPQFEECLNANKYSQDVGKGVAFGFKLGVSGIPAFVIALRDPLNPNKAKGISYTRGFRPFTEFQKDINQALANLSK